MGQIPPWEAGGCLLSQELSSFLWKTEGSYLCSQETAISQSTAVLNKKDTRPYFHILSLKVNINVIFF
jgi:hypothetical protein